MQVFHYCPDCGAALRVPDPSERLVVQSCERCGADHFKNAKPAAGALIVANGRVLLGRRATAPGVGQWDIPGGFLLPWEHPVDGVRREVAEETGLLIEADGIFSLAMDTYAGGYSVLNIFYLAHISGGAVRPGDDLATLAWFDPEELPDALAYESCREVLRAWRAKERAAKI